MRNPLRSEAEAYRFLLGTIVYFGLIVLAAVVGGTWWGVGVFAVLTARRSSGSSSAIRLPPAPKTGPRQESAEDETRILVVANETVGGRKLRDDDPRAVRGRARGGARRLSGVEFAAAHVDVGRGWGARGGAGAAGREPGAAARAAGINARGEVGDGDPLQAIEDALRTFGRGRGDRVDASGGPSNWLERGVVDGARERFTVRITHVVVDLDRESEDVR